MENEFAVGGILTDEKHKEIVDSISSYNFEIVPQESIEKVLTNMAEVSKGSACSAKELADVLAKIKPDKQFVGMLDLNGEHYRFTKK